MVLRALARMFINMAKGRFGEGNEWRRGNGIEEPLSLNSIQESRCRIDESSRVGFGDSACNYQNGLCNNPPLHSVSWRSAFHPILCLRVKGGKRDLFLCLLNHTRACFGSED